METATETYYNLFWSDQYGSSHVWHHSRVHEIEHYPHEQLIAASVPNKALHVFNYMLKKRNIVPRTVDEARSLWDLFYALYRFDSDMIEGRWSFFCSRYSRYKNSSL